jgi:hypothetical protein
MTLPPRPKVVKPNPDKEAFQRETQATVSRAIEEKRLKRAEETNKSKE